MAFTFPSSPSVGDQYPAPTGLLYCWAGEHWATTGEKFTPNPFLNYYRYRSIYTRGYMMAGYYSGTPWRNVNRTVHSTDITSNLGDILDNTGSYISGGFSIQYVGYLLSPTHKCVAIGNRYFGTPVKYYYKIISLWSLIVLAIGFVFTFL